MKVHFADGTILYDGTQLRSRWAERAFGVEGDSIVVFRGPCDIPGENIVDLEDLRAGARIAGPDMLHFIVEHFDRDLGKAVLRQRLLAVIAREEIERLAGSRIERRGDDLFDGGRKLSISIATLSPVSSRIHFALNVARAEDVGVPTGGLSDYGIDPGELGRAVAERYVSELKGIDHAQGKVREVP
ncbi:MAG: DUF366 family protein [Planctomycetota bacterium]|jgi:hypothetical protein